jgi:TatD DNase family protein
MILTDTHTHFYYERDPLQQDELLQRCLDNNVSRLFLPNVDSASVPMGLHPCDVKEDYESQLAFIAEAISKNKVYAIGEIGIDLYWDKTTLEIQKDAFRRQINQAKQLDLPINIHCREAFNEVYEILKDEKDDKLRGIFHCFTGSLEQARQIIELDFYLGIGGVVTYKNSGLDKVVAELDLNNLVLETDSPYLTPVPYRGKPNESSYLVYVAQKIADLHQLPLDKVAEITTQNSKKVYGI